MNKLTFNVGEVQAQGQHAIDAAAHRVPYEPDAPDPGPWVWWVKDQGTYIMTNGAPAEEGTPDWPPVAYAEGFDPDKVEFDDWWDALRAIAGGDDFGTQLIDLTSDFGRTLMDSAPTAQLIMQVDGDEVTMEIVG